MVKVDAGVRECCCGARGVSGDMEFRETLGGDACGIHWAGIIGVATIDVGTSPGPGGIASGVGVCCGGDCIGGDIVLSLAGGVCSSISGASWS